MPIKLDNLYRRFYKSIPHPSNYPIITNIQVSVDVDEATITWDTDVASSSQVRYGEFPNLALHSTYDGTPTTSHSVTISGLNRCKTYVFVVQSFYVDALAVSHLGYFAVPCGDFLLMEDGSQILLEDGQPISLEEVVP